MGKKAVIEISNSNCVESFEGSQYNKPLHQVARFVELMRRSRLSIPGELNRSLDDWHSSSSQALFGGMSKYSIQSLILAITFLAVLLAWFVDHRRLVRELEIERKQNWLAGESWEERRTRVKDVVNEPEPDVPMLLFALSDGDPIVRRTALAALKQIPITKYSDNPEANTEFERWLAVNEAP